MSNSICYTDTKVEDKSERIDLLKQYVERMESLGITDTKQYRRAQRDLKELLKG